MKEVKYKIVPFNTVDFSTRLRFQGEWWQKLSGVTIYPATDKMEGSVIRVSKLLSLAGKTFVGVECT